MYAYAIALIRVMHKKTARGVGLCGKCRNRVLRPTPCAVFFRTSRVNGALTDLLFSVGGSAGNYKVSYKVMDS